MGNKMCLSPCNCKKMCYTSKVEKICFSFTSRKGGGNEEI